jgi:hypothetical protein
MPNPNLELLELAAERLRQLLPEIVFVGGCATGLLIDDPGAAPVRGTYDRQRAAAQRPDHSGHQRALLPRDQARRVRGRGERDYLASHDLEDFIAVVDGRSSLMTEIESASSELKMYIADSVRLLLKEARFLDALPGYLLADDASQARIGQLLSKLRALGSRNSQ